MKKIAVCLLLAFIALALIHTSPVHAATQAEIDTAITNGLAWLAADQEADGSWPLYWEDVATTGLAVLKFEHRAYELGYASPFDPGYQYSGKVATGLDYLFTKLLLVNMVLQDHTAGASGTLDNPDSNGNGLGLYAHGHSYPFDVYDTGIVLSAISASGTPTRTVSVVASPVNGWQYSQVAQDMVDWLAFAQSDYDYAPNGMGEGGWSYGSLNNEDQMGGYGPDNSNSGYAVLGLGYALDFGCIVPQWVKIELNAYVTDIQDPVDGDTNDGGSWYHAHSDDIGVNILKTGNLIYEMALLGDLPSAPRVIAALDYLARHWGDASGGNQPPGWNGNPANYQAMFTTMKGLEFMGVSNFNGIDWYEDFSDAIIAQQINVPGPDFGSWQWSSERGNPTIITAWALLTLEKSARAPQAPVASFTESTHAAPTGMPITFDPSGSYDLDGTIVLYEWDWNGDGIYDENTATPIVVQHTYLVPGVYTVTLRVTDNDGLTDTASDTKTITPGQVIPEVPIGTIAASVSMIMALVGFLALPRFKRKR